MTFSNKNSNIMRISFFALILIVLVILVITTNKNTGASQTDPAQAEQSNEPDLDPGIAVAPPAVTTKPTVSAKPGTDNPDDKNPAPSPEDSAAVFSGPDVPEQPAAEDEFFSDAAFMGNSLMDGFRLFTGLTTCDYYAATSMTVLGTDSNVCITLDNGNQGTLVDGLLQKPYGKIYILLGINEIGYDVETFISYYGTMLDKIIAGQPDCNVYIMGLTPVSAAKSAGSDTFNMTRINSYNEALYQLAADKGCYYLDLVAALAGDDGYLPSDVTTDGVHFSAAVYQQWLDYVKTHYVVD